MWTSAPGLLLNLTFGELQSGKGFEGVKGRGEAGRSFGITTTHFLPIHSYRPAMWKCTKVGGSILGCKSFTGVHGTSFLHVEKVKHCNKATDDIANDGLAVHVALQSA